MARERSELEFLARPNAMMVDFFLSVLPNRVSASSLLFVRITGLSIWIQLQYLSLPIMVRPHNPAAEHASASLFV